MLIVFRVLTVLTLVVIVLSALTSTMHAHDYILLLIALATVGLAEFGVESWKKVQLAKYSGKKNDGSPF